MQLITSCVGLSAKEANNLMDAMDAALEITYRTFRRAVGAAACEEFAQSMGYATGYERGLRLSKDWHVRYYRSKWKANRCYICDHSSVEYIFQ